MRHITSLTALAFSVFATSALAVTYDESIDGDLATDPGTPTFIDFDAGSNLVSGSVAAPGDTRDFLTFTLEANERLVSIVLLDYTDLDNGGPGNRGFIALNEGATSGIPGETDADFFLGGIHLDPNLGQDLLLSLATDSITGSDPFSVPLGAGSYSVVIQQTGPQLTGYAVDFQVAVVPVPAAAWLFGAGLLSLGAMRRRRR
ncbi:MAG: VPLPA-CTERM sorting domain-containing protein [Pseudomonadota bacterium]